MHLRQKVVVALGATIVVALVAWIGTSPGGAAGGERSAKEDALPASLAKTIANPHSAVAEYELQASQARHVDLRNAGGSVWVVPGRTGGACLFQSDGGSCANADEIASGRLALVILPPPSAATAGSARFIGYAPAGVTAIRLVDKDGGVVSEITPQEDTRIYDFPLAQPGASAAVKMILADASGKAVSTLPLPGGGPVPLP